jgi:hypothetical protein
VSGFLQKPQPLANKGINLFLFPAGRANAFSIFFTSTALFQQPANTASAIF